MESFEDVKVGDIVYRILGNRPMKLLVGNIKDGLIYTGSFEPGIVDISWEDGWKFRIDNGMEVDEYLGWDGITATGSFLTKTPEKYEKKV